MGQGGKLEPSFSEVGQATLEPRSGITLPRAGLNWHSMASGQENICIMPLRGECQV